MSIKFETISKVHPEDAELLEDYSFFHFLIANANIPIEVENQFEIDKLYKITIEEF